jgi:hypothetical protein
MWPNKPISPFNLIIITTKGKTSFANIRGSAFLELAVVLAMLVLPLICFFPLLYEHIQRLNLVEEALQKVRLDNREPAFWIVAGLHGSFIRSNYTTIKKSSESSNTSSYLDVLSNQANELHDEITAIASGTKAIVEAGVVVPLINQQTGSAFHHASALFERNFKNNPDTSTSQAFPTNCMHLSSNIGNSTNNNVHSTAVICRNFLAARPTLTTSYLWKKVFARHFATDFVQPTIFLGSVPLARLGRTVHAIYGPSYWLKNPDIRSNNSNLIDYAYGNFARFGTAFGFYVKVNFPVSTFSSTISRWIGIESMFTPYEASVLFLPVRDL